MEPYNPNKPFLEFKFDKEKAKDELRNNIPGLRALEYYHQNPDSSITNSLDILAEDFVPFYANTKYGGDVGNYLEEALLFGTPAKFKEQRRLLKEHETKYPGTKYSEGDINYLDADADAKGLLGSYDPVADGYYNLEPNSINKFSYPNNMYTIGDYNATLKYIDDSENYLRNNPNPYDLFDGRQLDPMVESGKQLMFEESDLTSLKYRFNELNYNLKPGEQFVIVDNQDIIVKDKKGDYYKIDDYRGKLGNKVNLNNPIVKQDVMKSPTFSSRSLLDNEFTRRKKQFEYHKKLYEASYGDDVHYSDRWDWQEEIKDLRDKHKLKQTKDFYENVNPKQPWPYGE